MTKPWDRLQEKNESSKAYAAFCVYRDLGVGRSLEQVSQQHSKSIPLIKTWSAKFDWVDRVQAYDDYLLAKQQKKFEAKLAQFKEEVTNEAFEIRKRSAESMTLDKPGPRATTDRWVAATDVVMKVHGLDKQTTKTEHSGEIRIIINKEAMP